MDAGRCRANVAHIRQTRPDSGLGFQVKVRIPFEGVPSSLSIQKPGAAQVCGSRRCGAATDNL